MHIPDQARQDELGDPLNRVSIIDMCRGLLFAMMANSHALTLARVDQNHWLLSDIWLPNGWATIVFVVLSGYAAGYLFSTRTPELARDQALRRRGVQILAVMFASNIVFALLREVVAGHVSVVFQIDWYLGFFTLETDWTISGVLLPTGLLLLVAPWVMRGIKTSSYAMLAGLLFSQFALSIVKLQLQDSGAVDSWPVKFFLTEGFGGFPALPFLVNGCLGIWLGMTHRQNPKSWSSLLTFLAILQVIIYASTFWPSTTAGKVISNTVGAVGKFGWMFLVALTLMQVLPAWMGAAIQLIGRFALGSFVMHRVFLQSLAIGLAILVETHSNVIVNYVSLFGGTMALTWLLCKLRDTWVPIDSGLRKFGI